MLNSQILVLFLNLEIPKILRMHCLKIFTDLEKCSEMSKNAEKFFNLSYNWDVSSKSLVKVYKV